MTGRLLCTPCLRKEGDLEEDSRAVVKFCIECNENLCKACLKDHIRRASTANSKHTLLNKDEMPPWLHGGSEQPEVKSTCLRHPDNRADVYCPDHNVYMCGSCAVTHHRNCEKLAELFEEKGADKEISLLADTEKVIKDVDNTIQAKKREKTRVIKQTAEALAEVRKFREHVNEVFDKLEKTTVDEINTHCLENDDAIDQDIRKLEKQGKVLSISYTAVGEKGGMGQLQDASIRYHFRKTIFETAKLNTELSRPQNGEESRFQINPSVQKYIEGLKSFGEFVRRKQNIQREHVNVERIPVEYDTRDEVGILCVTPLRTGLVVMSDSENKDLKVLNSDYSVVKTLTLPTVLANVQTANTSSKFVFEPHAICRIDDETVAVSLQQDKTVAILKFSPTFDVSGVVCASVEEFCRGLSYCTLYDELYVCCGGGSYLGEGLGQVKVFHSSGKFIRAYRNERNTKRPLFALPRGVAVDSRGEKIFVADSSKGVVVFDRKGELLQICTSLDLEEPFAISADFDDNILVCGHASNNIIKIDKSFEKVTVLCGETHGIVSPMTLCVLPQKSIILLTMNNYKGVCLLTTTKK